MNVYLQLNNMPKKLPLARQQGKAYTKKQRAQIMKSIKPYLQLEYDLKNACILAGAPYETVLDWAKKDTALLIQIRAWQNSVKAKSRQNVAKSISKGNTENSKWWLKHRDKDNFASRNEVVGKDGGPIQSSLGEDPERPFTTLAGLLKSLPDPKDVKKS